jgi:hypothetical protein
MTETAAVNLRLSAQRALWGAVPASLRAFSVEISGHIIHVRSVFDETWTEEHKELLSIAGSEIISDFHAPFTIEEEFLNIPVKEAMKHLTHLIFLRHEP